MDYDWFRIRAVWRGQRSEVLGGEAAIADSEDMSAVAHAMPT
jgi:hypothetical protein